MNTKSSLISKRVRFAFLGLIVLALAVAGCTAPPAPAPASQEQAAPTTAPEPTIAPAVAAPEPTAVPTAEMSEPTTVPVTEGGAVMPATVMVVTNDQLGSFLADDQGRSLYLFTKDTPNTSNCYDKCEQAWPPLYTEGAPKAGTGADASLLGTTTRKDGKTQVTYGGWPLYYYIKDQKPGDVTGQDVGQVWYVLSPKGEKIEKSLAASATLSPVNATSTPSSGGSAGEASGQTVTVSVKDFAFNPKELTISPGTTVVWHNEDSARHTVTSDTGLFDGPLPSGADFQFTFTEPGTYAYYCKPHGGPGGEGMAAVVIVK